MVLLRTSALVTSPTAMAALLALLSCESAHAFGVRWGLGETGILRNHHLGATSSFLHACPTAAEAGRSGVCSPTSLSSSYVVKPEMARTRGSEWRKMRTRGHGFGEKVRRAKAAPDLSQMLADGLFYLNADEMDEIRQALAMSVYAHSLNSKHGGGYEAVKSGVEACLILGELEMGTDALLSAILSGVLRPSAQPSGFGLAAVTVADIEEGFGSRVARSVENFEHVTRLEEMAKKRMSKRVGVTSEPMGGLETGNMQGHYLRDLIISEATDWQVLTLHLAVHMQQLRAAIGSGASNAGQLARDALETHAPLAHRLGVHQLSGGLEDLAFKALFPAEYNKVRRATKARMGVYQEVMETAKAAISTALEKDEEFASKLAEPVTLQHRIKEPYSMWKKMRRQAGGVDSVSDAVALRVVLKAKREPGETDHSFEVKSRQLCYHVMSLAKRIYPAVDGRCKNYVQSPKPNGYQSLHSTHKVAVSPLAAASNGGNRHTHFELQVRTASMHHKAEYGHAAHWSYKGEGKDTDAGVKPREKKTWTAHHRTWKALDAKMTRTPAAGMDRGRSVVPESVSSGQELVTWLHLELRRRKVFVFGPDNLIWELDKASATAEKVLGRGEGKDMSLVEASTLVNGKAVPMHYTFKNGDVLDVDVSHGGVMYRCV